jgi:membrane-bound lytic murein transglycosylase D
MRSARAGWAVAAAFHALFTFAGGRATAAEAAPEPQKKPESPKAESPRPEAPKPEAPRPPVPEPAQTKNKHPAKGDAAAKTRALETSAPPPGETSEDDSLGPGPGPGARKVRPAEEPEPRAAPPPPAPKSVPHTKGKPPKQPSPTLPAGATPEAVDVDARRQIVGGATVDDLTSGKNDPELKELREAERVLFPKPLKGAQAGFSWDLPAPIDDGSAPVDASGLPAGTALPASSDKLASKKDASRDAVWLGKLTLPTLPVRLDARVIKYLKFYRDDTRGKNILRIWAKKCGRLSPALRAEFARAGLPTDLIWLSLIESGHNPTIVSSAGAAGLWQFIPESGRMYGLTVDRWVDERLDPERSTEAAVRYLTDLRSRFGSWELAMAAYNMGHGGLLRAMRKFNTNDFWTLSRFEAGLPWETSLYVPKIMATAIAMTNKKAFGIDDVTPDLPIAFDVVWVQPGVDLADVARAADAPASDVVALNALYPSGRTPPATSGKRFAVRVPPGRGLAAEQRLAQGTRRAEGSPEPRVVRFGDTLESVASEMGMTARELAALNRIGESERIAAGLVLLVPAAPQQAKGPPPPGAQPAAQPDEVFVVQPRRFDEGERRRVFYRVIAGDQLPAIAAAFGVAPSEVAAWNAVDSAAWLQPGMGLQIYVNEDFDLSRVRALREHEVRVLVAGSAEFFEYFEAQNGRKRVTVLAKKDETLAAVGKRYGMSAAMMERINRVPASTKLAAGDKVIVYAKGPVENAKLPEYPRPLSAIVAPKPDALPALPSVPGPSASPPGVATR